MRQMLSHKVSSFAAGITQLYPLQKTLLSSGFLHRMDGWMDGWMDEAGVTVNALDMCMGAESFEAWPGHRIQ